MRHRFHALCPYFAMFPEAFAEHWIERLSSPGDYVLDPFCGRGTAPFQALLLGRNAIGNDINPVAYCVSRAKTNAPTLSALKRRLTTLEKRFEPNGCQSEAAELPEFFHAAYTGHTLLQLVFMRRTLHWRVSAADCMLASLILGALHGETRKSPSYLSNQMPRTISTKPDYSVRFWRQHGLTAPDRDLFALLRSRVEFRYASQPPTAKAEIFHGDFRNLPGLLRGRKEQIRLVVTSPPYLDVTNFEEDQWLRLWFLGGPPHPTYRRVSSDDRHENPSRYWALIGDMWRVLGRVAAKKAYVVIRLGGSRLSPTQITAGLEATSLFSQRKVTLVSTEVSQIRGRQTDAFRPGSKGCSFEVDCCFRLA